MTPYLLGSISKQDKGVVRLAPANPEKHRPATPCGDVRLYQDFAIMIETLSKDRRFREDNSSSVYQGFYQRRIPGLAGASRACGCPPDASGSSGQQPRPTSSGLQPSFCSGAHQCATAFPIVILCLALSEVEGAAEPKNSLFFLWSNSAPQ